MNKKTYLQFFLFAIIIILTYSFYKTYFNQEPISKVPRNIKDESVSENKSNMIHNIEYNTKDDAGNSYIIKSKKGELNLEDPDLILMKGVTAVISMVNSTPIKIYSDNAIYNKSNYKKGKVNIGKHTIIGSGSVILPNISIANNSSIGALTLVNKDIRIAGIYAGIPCKKIKT